MPTEKTFPPSGLLQYLPAIYREDPFLGQFLLAFEKILLGRDDSPVEDKPAEDKSGEDKSVEDKPAEPPDPDLNPKGLEQIVDGLATLYDPQLAPAEFLPWLSKWVALSLRADMTLDQQRDFLSQIVRLYEYRGTQANLVRLLKLFLVATPTVEVLDDPYTFHVRITLKEREKPGFVSRQKEIAYALIELEKPAHTKYTLDVNVPTLQIGVEGASTVGVDTLLGTVEQAAGPEGGAR